MKPEPASTTDARPYWGWSSVLRLGLVQACLGAVVVLTTSTLNRIMVVELALPALLPGILVAMHYLVQVLRPRMGYGSDMGRRRTPWIVGGMAVLAAGGVVAAIGTAWIASSRAGGIALAVLGFAMIGVGVSACGTSLLVLLAARTDPVRRAGAATVVWLMMIVGFAVTAGLAGRLLDPYSPMRLVAVSAAVSLIAFCTTLAATWRLEGAPTPASPEAVAAPAASKPPFREAIAQVWAEPVARRFTIFVFVSMLAYSAQDLILEPFAGSVFGYTPGQSTGLAGVQHGGVLLGMLAAALAGRGARFGSLKAWQIGGCLLSGLMLLGLAASAFVGPAWPFKATVFLLGASNGAFSIAAIASMMRLAIEGRQAREGVRMGLWGAAQAVAFGVGGLVGTGASDVARWLIGRPSMAYAAVFAFEAALFVMAAMLAARLGGKPARASFSKLAAQADLADAGRNPPLRLAPTASADKDHPMSDPDLYDVVVIGGGPAGATAAEHLARGGRSVLLLDRAGRTKPCGGAIPPRLIKDYAIPDTLLVARATAARMVSPKDRRVDIPIENGFVGMVDRDAFDEWLRERAASSGAVRRVGRFDRLERDDDGVSVVHFEERAPHDRLAWTPAHVRAKAVVGADGARSEVARQAVPGASRTRYVFAYHEILRTPDAPPQGFDPARCDVYYRGTLSPDFYGWVFPHGATMSVGTGSADKGFSLRGAVGALRGAAGLEGAETLRREGAPIPMKPLPRWDNGRDVVLAGDAAGVVAPASGEGIYYAMVGGQLAAEAVEKLLATGDVRSLAHARKAFMKAHGTVFRVLGLMQWFWYSSDRLRERFVSICQDKDVQQLTFESYMNKKLVRRKPMAHVRIFFKDLGHLVGLARV